MSEHRFVQGKPVRTRRQGEKVSIETEVCSWCGIIRTVEEPARYRMRSSSSREFLKIIPRCTGMPTFGEGSEACAPLGKMKRTAS